MIGLMDFIKSNLSHVTPIILVGIFAVAIILERARALFIIYPLKNEEDFFERVQELVMIGKVPEAVALCDKYPNKPVTAVVKKALLRVHQPESLIENGLEIAVEDAVQRVQRRTNFLAMIANVATLLGLLGTIFGLVQAFQAVGSSDAVNKASLLAQGISTAMNATIMGLGVAIPAMIAFSFLSNRSNRLVSSVESSAAKTMDIIRQRFLAAEEQKN